MTKKRRVQKKKHLKPGRIETGKNIKFDYSVLVTGFARTGTSTMMRKLHFGGMDVICDPQSMVARHQFDPYGNFEMDAPLYNILEHKNTWTRSAATKVVCPHVVQRPGLPMDRPWKAIFMLRPIAEIHASLAALNTVWEYEPQDAIRDCKRYLEMYDAEILFVTYKDMVDYPKATALRLNHFLDLGLDQDLMIKAVSKTPREDYQGERIIRAPREVIHFGETAKKAPEDALIGRGGENG
jgi:hypothetical protein